ncbi:hypothetical protein PSHT_06243 [Puccinia striiformis]|uniref:Uncharacterized protein n=1 Tax=Puccinia striiformis TaxID=27350 RepID=A0A2S4W7S8_9BASI|nr:hypothetical protein PSHT_06243 [Puccinia striiformis]
MANPGIGIPLCEPSPIDGINPRLPRVGDLFECWDHFRSWSRKAAEARGFTLSQSQSKGSSGTIVLRCSRFKEPGTVGQKMAENGCEVVYKVMRAKNGVEGFEVVHAYEEHNHPFGPDMPVGHRPGTSLSGQGPKRKKVKTSTTSGAGSDVGNPGSSHSQNVSNAATPPPSTSGSKPFLFDPYTGKPIRSSATPIPAASTSTPSPPTHLDPPPVLHPPSSISQSLAHQSSVTKHKPSSSLAGTPRSHSSRAGSRPTTSTYPLPNSAISDNLPGSTSNHLHLHHHHPKPTPEFNMNEHPATLVHRQYPPLSIKLSIKAQNSINDFLNSISPHLTIYTPHFKWLGIHSPSDLLSLIDDSSGIEGHGEQELEAFLDEFDTSGLGLSGEGVTHDEKSLIIRALRKLSSIRSKA